ncbi:MAG TPA: AAA family ATPase, partial [Jatrophihabitans sp.]|nr:AAA family ATPase [Jatrophihabitans sp.]
MSATGARAELVERDDALASLVALVEDACESRGRLAFLGGEAGVGKTTLLGAVPALAAGRLLVRRGHCDNVTTPAPLGPFADATPELGELLDDDSLSRPRLFRRLRALLTQVPTLLLLEDVHWADEATLDLLRYLGRRVGEDRLLIVATYRSDDVAGPHPLALLRGDLATVDAVRAVDLRPLGEAGVAELVRRAGSSLDPGQVHRSTGGNPFFVTELLAVGADELPPTVRDAVLARAARLSAGANAVLAAAAVIGPRCPVDLLLAASG